MVVNRLNSCLESDAVPTVDREFQLVFTGLTLVVSRGNYQCVSCGIQVLYTLFMKGMLMMDGWID